MNKIKTAKIDVTVKIRSNYCSSKYRDIAIVIDIVIQILIKRF